MPTRRQRFPFPAPSAFPLDCSGTGSFSCFCSGLAAQVPPEDQGKMPQQPHGNDVGRPFGHLFQRIVGGAENGYQPAGMQRVLPPAHLVQGPAGYPQRFVHPDDGVIMAAGFRKNGHLGFIGFRLGRSGVEFRHKAVEADVKGKLPLMHAVALRQFHLVHGHGHSVAQHDAGQQKEDSAVGNQDARMPPRPSHAEHAAQEQVDEQQGACNAHAGQRQGNEGVLPAQGNEHVGSAEEGFYGRLRSQGGSQPDLVQGTCKCQHQQDEHQGDSQPVAAAEFPEFPAVFPPRRFRMFPVPVHDMGLSLMEKRGRSHDQIVKPAPIMFPTGK